MRPHRLFHDIDNKSVLNLYFQFQFIRKLSLVSPRLSQSETVHERETDPVTIPILLFQVDAYQNFCIVSHWLIEKHNKRLTGKKSSKQLKKSLGKTEIEFLTDKPSVMHSKHECTYSQGRESRDNETTW